MIFHSYAFTFISFPKTILCLMFHWRSGAKKWVRGIVIAVVQSLSRVQLFVTPWIAACQASLSITNSRACPNSCPLSQWCHPNLSQHQGIFQWVSSSHQVARVLEFRLQHQSFQWIFRTDFLQSCFLWVCFLNSKVVLSWMLWFTWQHTRKSLKYCCKYLNATSICI